MTDENYISYELDEEEYEDEIFPILKSRQNDMPQRYDCCK